MMGQSRATGIVSLIPARRLGAVLEHVCGDERRGGFNDGAYARPTDAEHALRPSEEASWKML
jgi:hypothetical protein